MAPVLLLHPIFVYVHALTEIVGSRCFKIRRPRPRLRASRICCAPQAHAHQFHYETSATLLYWFGTRPILAHRSQIHLLANLLILGLFQER